MRQLKAEVKTYRDYSNGEVVPIKRFVDLDDVDNQRLMEIITRFYEEDWAGREEMHQQITKK